MLRNYHLAREVARAADVTYLSFSDEGELTGVNSHRSHEPPIGWCENVVGVRRARGYTLQKLLRGALGQTPVTVLNYTTREMASQLSRLLAANSYDLVQVESIHLARYLPLIRAARKSPIALLDWHNVESEIMARYAERAKGLARRLYARRTTRQLQAYERQALREFDLHLAVSDRDRAQLKEQLVDATVEVVENGVATEQFTDDEIERAYTAWPANETRDAESCAASTAGCGPRRRVLFVGSMDYHANVDAVVSFARDVWPFIARESPDLILTIVGREPAPEVRALPSVGGIEVTGTVEDVRPFYRDALASVIPLKVGGGSRLKILEAMAAGVPVVSTRLGAEGLDVRDGEQITLAETANDFRLAITRLNDETIRSTFAAAGRELVRTRYDWSSIGATLLKIYQRLLRVRASSAAQKF
jgi:glycosyltransferase involved in cell wall biosynthesis